MIYILTAMYAEAHPLITRFQLKKELSHTRFQVFLNPEAGILLIVSGTGLVPAAAALGSICTEYGAGQGDFLVNVGICGQIWNNGQHDTNQPADENTERAVNNCQAQEGCCQRGRIFLCSKIKEQSTGKTFYPDILYRHRFAEAQIITVAKPYKKTAPSEIEAKDFSLYDMEAAAVYQAGAYYFGPHQMSFLKVISDDGNTENITAAEVERLIAGNMESIADHIEGLQTIARWELPDEAFQNDSVQKELEKLCLDMHCSKVMSESLRQYIRYCILAGADYHSVVEDMYREGKLPCRDKREGKQRFEELRERLL